MADISHVFYFYLFVIFVIHKQNKLKQKRCQNNANLRRIGGSKIVICLMQREVISVNFVN